LQTYNLDDTAGEEKTSNGWVGLQSVPGVGHIDPAERFTSICRGVVAGGVARQGIKVVVAPVAVRVGLVHLFNDHIFQIAAVAEGRKVIMATPGVAMDKVVVLDDNDVLRWVEKSRW